VLRWLRRYAILALQVCLALSASLPVAESELEVRSELRAGDLLFNTETILAPFQISIFHGQTLAATDTEAFAISPLTVNGDSGFSLAQTSDRTMTATQTGFLDVHFPNFRIVDFPTAPIGQGLAWVQDVQPIRIAGLPQNTAMIFPAMTEITRIDNRTGLENYTSNNSSSNPRYNSSNNTSYDPGYIINNNFSKPYYPGNMMVVRNVTNDKGENETVIRPATRDYMTIVATPQQVANKTIIERMWRNVHLNYFLDWSYSGETCCPDQIWPVKNPYAVTFHIPLDRSNRDALILTRPGQHIKRLFWPVAVE
jgi:hypothetical protein